MTEELVDRQRRLGLQRLHLRPRHVVDHLNIPGAQGERAAVVVSDKAESDAVEQWS